MNNAMTEKDILDTFKMLACSQGFYGRLLERLNECDEDTYNDFMNDLVEQNFTDPVDLIMYIEC